MPEITGDQSDVVAFLSDPQSYGPGVDVVERQETHGAIVFLAGDKAYKLKRAVRYAYMDFSTVARREAMCRREIDVNRSGAPGLYLGVCPVLRDGARFRLGTPDEREGARDWVVVMRRFPQSALLEPLARRGALPLGLMRSLGEAIADFHERAERVLDSGGSEGMRSVIEENASQLAGVPEIFEPDAVAGIVVAWRETLEALAPLLDRRRRDGKVRRCHGDLHLNNIFLDETGKPVLFDAIEFEDAFSCIDVLYDLSFLIMDLERHGLRRHANLLLNRYLEKTFDFEGLAALPLFLSCRAALRAHVRAAASLLAADEDKRQRESEARALFDLAGSFMQRARPELIAIGGVSGTGKTTLAYDLAPDLSPAPGALVLRSDVFRKHLANVPETERLPEAAYSRDARLHVYDALLSSVRAGLDGGHSVIVDAVFGGEAERSILESLARKGGVPFHGLWLGAPQDILEARVRGRRGDASDATIDVLRGQLASVVPPGAWLHVDCSGTSGETLRAAEQALALPVADVKE